MTAANHTLTPPRILILVDEARRRVAATVLANAPLGIEVVFRPVTRRRTLDQNALYWSGPLRDIAEQVWIDGRQHTAEVWHEYFRREFMPEDDDIENGTTRTASVRAGQTGTKYRKWEYLPDKSRVCVASTTMLTSAGFGDYLEQVYAFGAAHGVLFSASPR